MTYTVERVLVGTAPIGTDRFITVHRFGTVGASPKVYIQGGLHADEAPGMVVASTLVERLKKQEDRITGEIIVVPVANPVGLDQWSHHQLNGRFFTGDGSNFNRDYPDLLPSVRAHINGRLGQDAENNTSVIRNALKQAVMDLVPTDHGHALRKTLMLLAIDADIVLDLHCDDEALVHLYCIDPLVETGRELAADIGAAVLMTADVSGGHPFDEVFSHSWAAIAALVGSDLPIASRCFAATVEYRGSADVNATLAGSDADALIRFLTRQGALDGEPTPVQQYAGIQAPLNGVDMIRSPTHGIVLFYKTIGDSVSRDDVVAEIIDPSNDRPETRVPLRSRTDGLLWGRISSRITEPGKVVAKVAGANPIPGREGALLTA